MRIRLLKFLYLMNNTYKHTTIEKKWQARWLKAGIYKTSMSASKKKFVLDMFPYPSGASMHVGHLEGYVGTDILSRYLRMQGHSVLHPMGWDAFGLPAENYAIKTGINPDKSTHENIKTFKRQLESAGMSYDWDQEIDTSSPEFYKWTQWLFIQLFKKGLAYKKKAPVNWCPKDETVLANEQVIEGKCERCDTEVIEKDMDQWFFKITAYADRLISGLEKVDWLPEVKRQQINWIGRKEGVKIHHKVKGSDIILTAFSAYPAWLFADTFLVIAPEHPLVNDLVRGTKYEKEVLGFVESFKKKRGKGSKIDEKEGIFTGRLVMDPFSGKEMPVWLANFALMDFGTGIIRCSAHDPRDYDFATKYKILLKEVVARTDPDLPVNAHNNSGILVDSGPFSGKTINDKLIEEIVKWIVKEKIGEKETTYHLRDWLISRQRYWGCPIPMIKCNDCGWNPVPDSDLPVLLPLDVDFQPHGESPIVRSETFQEGVKCPKCGKPAIREVDTMDTYVDSSWYFIRFVDPKNMQAYASDAKLKAWMPVDDYVGGGHVVQHLLFARFFWKFLFDEGLIDKSLGDEPFLKLRAPGWILGQDSRKMSKRWGNVVTPDDIIPKFGADTLRLYEMFMGPFEVMKPWSMTGVEGANRFLGRVWRLFHQLSINNHQLPIKNEVLVKLHQTIKKVTNDIEEYKFNTAISSLMELVNVIYDKGADKDVLKTLALLLAPFAPHIAEEAWVEILGQPFSIHKASWPAYNAKYIKTSSVPIIVQVNGKTRGVMEVDIELSKDKEKVIGLAKKDLKVAKWLKGSNIKKEIFVDGKLVNFVIQ